MFSWLVAIQETSVSLSQPPPMTATMTERKSAKSECTSPTKEISEGYELVDGPEGVATSEECEVDSIADVEVLRLVVSQTNVNVGFRAERGFALEGSVGAVLASGLDAVPFLSIDPAVLWGIQGSGDHVARFNGPEGDILRAFFFILVCVAGLVNP